MAGSWERQESVLTAILHVDTTTIAWALGLRNLQLPGPILPIAGRPYDHARNDACMQMLDAGFDWLFFLDSDVIPPPDCVPRLMAHRQPIISGVYCRRSPPQGVPVMMKPTGQWVTKFPRNKVIEVDVVGSGCLLIHRSVLESLPPLAPTEGAHWFHWRSDHKGLLPDDWCLSEDFAFCRHAREHGYKVLVDTSIQCRHVGHAEAAYASFQPLVA